MEKNIPDDLLMTAFENGNKKLNRHGKFNKPLSLNLVSLPSLASSSAPSSAVLQESESKGSYVSEEDPEASGNDFILENENKLDFFETKVKEFLRNPKNKKDVAARVYSRQLVQLLRSIAKVSC